MWVTTTPVLKRGNLTSGFNIHDKNPEKRGSWRYKIGISVLWKQRQVDCPKFKASLDYKTSHRKTLSQGMRENGEEKQWRVGHDIKTQNLKCKNLWITLYW